MTNRMTLRLRAAATSRPTDSHSERGANLVEYALLVAFIAIVCVGAVTVLGDSTSVPYSQIGSQLAR